MADNRNSRDKQARDVDRRQRERAMLAELERGDETEPPTDPSELDAFEEDLDGVSFPATGAAVVAALGDREVVSAEGTYTVAELVPATDAETFDSPDAVRLRVARPTVAAAMKRVAEADDAPGVTFGTSQYEAYERTFRALKAIDADDDDEGIEVIGDWIVEQVNEKGAFPGSRQVRKRAATFCRSNGYEVRDDEWLGA